MIALLLTTLLATTPARAQLLDVTQVATLTAAAASPRACVYPPAAAPSCVKLDYQGFQGVGVLVTGSFADPLVAEISLDGGTTWTSVNVVPLTALVPNVPVPTIRTSGSYAVSTVGGGQVAQIRRAVFTTGPAVVTLRGTTATPVSGIVSQSPAPWRVALRGAPVTQVTSASNAAVSIAPGTGVVVSVAAYCSAGSATLTITDSGTTVWSTPAATITTAIVTFSWTPTPLAFVGAGNITLGACGTGNTGTLSAQIAPLP